MSKKYNKEQITQLVLNNLPSETIDYGEISLEKVIFRWWETGRSGNSLRLKEEGDRCFKLAGIAYHEYFFNRKNKEIKNPKFFTFTLQKKINCPFYLGLKMNGSIKEPYIHIYDSKIAMLINLFGSIEDFIQSEVKL